MVFTGEIIAQKAGVAELYYLKVLFEVFFPWVGDREKLPQDAWGP